jgi:citrate lyase subunit gamma (acyl carrier protein)
MEAHTAQAGTLESMDCLVTITGAAGKRTVEISGSSAVRFRTAIEKKTNEVLDALAAPAGLRVTVQDNGALDVVLGARVEAALKRYAGGAAK